MFDSEQILLRRLEEYASIDQAELGALILPTYLVWHQGTKRFALPLEQLVGVGKLRITPVPLSSTSLVGLTHYLDTFWPVRSVEPGTVPVARTFIGNILFLRGRRLGLWCDHELTLSSAEVSHRTPPVPIPTCPGLSRVGYCDDGSVLLEVEVA